MSASYNPIPSEDEQAVETVQACAGCSRPAAMRAICLSGGIVDKAVDWALTHAADPDFEAPCELVTPPDRQPL